MFNVVDAFGYPSKLVEQHPNIDSLADAKKILRQWMAESDRLEVLETRDINGMKITPIVIVNCYGEDSDIIGHLIK